MQSIEDDIWPINGDEDPEEDGAGWDGTGSYATHQQISKRRRLESNEQRRKPHPSQVLASTYKATNPSVTMQDAATFSVSSTTLHTDFVSAGSHLQDLAHQEPGNRTKAGGDILRSHRLSVQSQAGNKRSVSSTSHERSIKLSQPREGQGSLFSFFARTAKSDQAPRRNSLMPASPPNTITQFPEEPCCEEAPRFASAQPPKAISSKVPDQTQPFWRPREPMLPIPPSLAEHRLRSSPISTRPQHVGQENSHKSKQYLFLSSSPPTVESLLEEAEANDGKVSRVDKFKKDHTETVFPDSDIRPAATFHTTSTAQIQSTQTTQKTLGVRRSMNGWSSRGGHSFSVPGRADRTARSSDREANRRQGHV